MPKLLILLPLLWLATAAMAAPITYQGQLQDQSGPYTGTIDMTFRLFDSASGGGQIGNTVSIAAVSVESGLFQVELDFGSEVFSQGPRYLEVEVGESVLNLRQPITPAPMALNVINLPDTGDTLAELSCLTGEVPKWDGSAWVCAEDEDTQFIAGEGLQLSGTSLSLDAGFTDGRYWKLGGNSGIDSTEKVLGTTDFSAVEIHVDGLRAFRVEPSSSSSQEPNLIGGHESNAVLGGATRGATIAGGGGLDNDNANVVSGSWGFIGGGLNNFVQGIHGVVSGGASNKALGLASTVGGGTSNEASGMRSVVSGGFGNEAQNQSATVPGGSFNRAEGEYSFAAGLRARALHRSTFVWAGLDSTDDVSSTGSHQFLIAASGGVGINTQEPQFELDVDGTIRGGTVRSTGQVLAGGTLFVQTLGSVNGTQELCRVPPTGLITTCSSSSLRYKHEVEDFDLSWEQVLALRPVSYRFIEDDQPDIGLIAEELAEVDERLVVFDEQGRPDSIRYGRLSVLLLAALQERENARRDALEAQAAQNANMQARMSQLEAENAKLRQLAERNTELEDRLARLEGLLVDDGQFAWTVQ
ncbi:MAG: hypothetical protein EA418_05550 [Wenzhouxiangellaceae bacterium]|nr:MAG: hypothetical protein EA418_05550 [Wenzhouxiangellaceae bacterium]